ncbi:MAG: helix-turn-helix transcriptional regulator [Firmicutes bacterium]|nr:helix-turn-helix transcriptional regulator [Bacillota bacterium]
MTWEEKYQEILARIREGGNICPIMYAVSVIGQKWKIPILWQLAKSEKPMRFSEIRKALKLTDAMLSKTLDELEEHKMIERIQYDCIPPRVEYTLSCKGKTLLPALLALRDWGAEQIREESLNCEKE